MSAALESLLHPRRLWRGRQPGWRDATAVATGFAGLDERLPGGGWPRGALSEILLPAIGIGELRLLMPALRQLNEEGRWIALVAPPYFPYAPAWQSEGIDLSRLLWVRPPEGNDAFWAIEQALRAGACGAVLAWPERAPGFQRLRRLQLAAEAGDCLGILFLSPRQAGVTPAALRLQLEPGIGGLDVHVLKARGATAGGARVSIPDG